MLPVVLVVDHGLDVAKLRFEQTMFGHARSAGAICVSAPGDIRAREIGIGFPAALVDQRLETRTIGTRLGAEQPKPCAALSFLHRDTLGSKPGHISADTRGQRIDLSRFIECGDRAHRRIEEIYLGRKGVAKEARQPKRHIDARPVEHRRRHNFEPGHPTGADVPRRLHAHQRKRLGDVIAAGPHVGRTPGAYCHPPRPFAVLLTVALNHQRRRLPAEAPRRRRRHRPGVDRIKIAAGRQHLRTTSGRRS